MQAETQDSRMREKDGEVLRLLNQIATDMIRKDDVDRLVAEAVAKATAELKADYEERMKSMAAEYEARIAELQSGKGKKGSRRDKNQCHLGAQPCPIQEDPLPPAPMSGEREEGVGENAEQGFLAEGNSHGDTVRREPDPEQVPERDGREQNGEKSCTPHRCGSPQTDQQYDCEQSADQVAQDF